MFLYVVSLRNGKNIIGKIYPKKLIVLEREKNYNLFLKLLTFSKTGRKMKFSLEMRMRRYENSTTDRNHLYIERK